MTSFDDGFDVLTRRRCTGSPRPRFASRHNVTEFFPGKTAGEKAPVTPENLITRMKNWGTNPPVLFEIEAINDNEDLEDRYTTIKVLAPTLTEICAEWPARGLSGLDASPRRARDTAIVFAAAPEPMRCSSRRASSTCALVEQPAGLVDATTSTSACACCGRTSPCCKPA